MPFMGSFYDKERRQIMELARIAAKEEIKLFRNTNLPEEVGNLTAEIQAWGKAKGINNVDKQILKIHEEAVEVHDALYKEKGELAVKTEIGDVLVTTIILADILGFDIQECLQLAHDKNKVRTGKNIAGNFIKDEK